VLEIEIPRLAGISRKIVKLAAMRMAGEDWGLFMKKTLGGIGWRAFIIRNLRETGPKVPLQQMRSAKLLGFGR